MKKNLSLIVVVAAMFFLGGCGSPKNNPPVNAPSTPAANQPSELKNTTNPTSNPPVVEVPSVQSDLIKNINVPISIKDSAFKPAQVTIKKGSRVIWTNKDSVPHSIKSAIFNSQILSQEQSFSFVFNEAGTFDYSCSIHPSMTGKIIVE
jgi:plastocyanin